MKIRLAYALYISLLEPLLLRNWSGNKQIKTEPIFEQIARLWTEARKPVAPLDQDVHPDHSNHPKIILLAFQA